jgi:hypothetical protein
MCGAIDSLGSSRNSMSAVRNNQSKQLLERIADTPRSGLTLGLGVMSPLALQPVLDERLNMGGGSSAISEKLTNDRKLIHKIRIGREPEGAGEIGNRQSSATGRA